MNEQGYKAEIEKIENLLKEYHIESDPKTRKALAREIALIHILDKEQTFDFQGTVKEDRDRQTLKDYIYQQLIDLPLLREDEAIKFGRGGCKPRYNAKAERQAMILLGLPASGKSTVAQVMSDIRGAYLIDSDIAKRKFPEFNFPNGATWVHEESDEIALCRVNGVVSHCLQNGLNMVIPKIGSKQETIKELFEHIKSFDYDVSLGLVDLPKAEAVYRAMNRYKNSKRYVPIQKIIESTDPKDTFEALKHEFHSTIHLSSKVDEGYPYELKYPTDCIWW